jgi:hypothetical protein
VPDTGAALGSLDGAAPYFDGHRAQLEGGIVCGPASDLRIRVRRCPVGTAPMAGR